MSFGNISTRMANKQEADVLNNLIGFINKNDWDGVKTIVSEFGKMIDLMLLIDNIAIISNPVCHAVIKTGNLSMVKFFMSDVEFDPSDDDLIVTAIETSQPDIVEFVIKIVPTIEKWEMVDYAKTIGDKNIVDLVVRLI